METDTSSRMPEGKSWGSWLPLPDIPASEVRCFTVTGKPEGPKVWIQGCAHGDEFDAALVVHHLESLLEPSSIIGEVVGIPIVNARAYQLRSRVGADGENLNRCFPGDPDGSETERLASTIWTQIAQSVDIVIDVHSSTTTYLGEPHAIYMVEETRAGELSGKMAKSSGLPIVWESTGGWLSNALYAQASGHGKASVLVDVGELDHVGGDVERAAHNLKNLLQSAGVVTEPPRPSSAVWTVRNPEWVVAPVSGLRMDAISTGTLVASGDTLFDVIDPIDGNVTHVRSPIDGLVITILRDHVVQTGTEVMSIGVVV